MNDKSIKAYTEDSENLNDSNDLMQVADEIFNTNESEGRSRSGTLTFNSIKQLDKFNEHIKNQCLPENNIFECEGLIQNSILVGS